MATTTAPTMPRSTTALTLQAKALKNSLFAALMFACELKDATEEDLVHEIGHLHGRAAALERRLARASGLDDAVSALARLGLESQSQEDGRAVLRSPAPCDTETGA